MDRKLIEVSGIVFVLIFLGVFLVIVFQSRQAIKDTLVDMDKLTYTQSSFNISLFDNTLVSGRSIKNLKNEMDNNPTTYALKVQLYTTTNNGATKTNCNISTIKESSTYRSMLYYEDEIVKGIMFQEVLSLPYGI